MATTSIYNIGLYQSGENTDIEDSLVNKTVVEYVSDKITTIGTGVFYYCSLLVKADFSNATTVKGTAFIGVQSLRH